MLINRIFEDDIIACGGAFDIDIDGDMFKVRMTFPLAAPAEITEEKTAVTADA